MIDWLGQRTWKQWLALFFAVGLVAGLIFIGDIMTAIITTALFIVAAVLGARST